MSLRDGLNLGHFPVRKSESGTIQSTQSEGLALSSLSLSSHVGMVSVPKTNPIPQLSIVVPIGRDVAGFESTLISVLENQPEGSEVIVPHDGRYDDPFDLCEEVRFVVASSSSFLDMVGAAASQARGRFVHVLADGMRASCGWTAEALECFDHFDTGVVAPVIRSASNQRIVAAGWSDGSSRMCQSAGQGKESVAASSRIGAYLQASFWRRDVLRSMHRAFDGKDVVEASVVYHHLTRQGGWRTELAPESTVLCDSDQLPWESTSLHRGLRLRAVRNHFAGGGGWGQSITASGFAMLGSILSPKSMFEAVGQGLAPLAANKIANLVHAEEVTVCDDRGMIVSMPQRHAAPLRRAA